MEKITNELTSSVLMMAKKISKQQSYEEINHVIQNGKAAEKFNKMVYALGGPINFLEKYNSYLQHSSYVGEIKASSPGSINSIETRELGLILIELGGGRKQINDKIDFSVGYEEVVSVGDKVDALTPLLKVHTASKSDFEKVKNNILGCFNISNHHSDSLDTIYKIIN